MIPGVRRQQVHLPVQRLRQPGGRDRLYATQRWTRQGETPGPFRSGIPPSLTGAVCGSPRSTSSSRERGADRTVGRSARGPRRRAARRRARIGTRSTSCAFPALPRAPRRAAPSCGDVLRVAGLSGPGSSRRGTQAGESAMLAWAAARRTEACPGGIASDTVPIESAGCAPRSWARTTASCRPRAWSWVSPPRTRREASPGRRGRRPGGRGDVDGCRRVRIGQLAGRHREGRPGPRAHGARGGRDCEQAELAAIYVGRGLDPRWPSRSPSN